MKYQTPTAFRTALEVRLLQHSRQRSVPLIRLRKQVVFERLLARLMVLAPGKWTVKGGAALIFRVGDAARTTKDLDLARRGDAEAATDDLMSLDSVDMDDCFSFSIARVADLDAEDKSIIARYRVMAMLDGRRFEQITVDVGFNFSFDDRVDQLRGQSLLEFADLPPIEIPALPLERHLAEKLHAYTRTFEGNRVNTRVRDLVDIILIAAFAEFQAARLRTAIEATFADRASQLRPRSIPLPPSVWDASYQRLAREVDLDPDVNAGHARAAAFLDPILQGAVADEARWDSASWAWQIPTDR